MWRRSPYLAWKRRFYGQTLSKWLINEFGTDDIDTLPRPILYFDLKQVSKLEKSVKRLAEDIIGIIAPAALLGILVLTFALLVFSVMAENNKQDAMRNVGV